MACLLGVSLVMLWWMNRAARLRGGHDLSGFIFMAPVPILAGVGMLWLRKWGALLIALPLAGVLVLIGYDLLVREMHVIAALANSGIFGVPIALVVWTWPVLRWSGRRPKP